MTVLSMSDLLIWVCVVVELSIELFCMDPESIVE